MRKAKWNKNKRVAQTMIGEFSVDDERQVDNYSTSISAAWEVVEQLGKDYGIQNQGDSWIVFTGYHDWIAAVAPTAPLAICLAALKAKGVIT